MEASEYFAMAKLLLAFRKFPFYYNLLKLPMHSLCITCKVNTATLWNRDGLAKVVFKDAVGWQLRNENFIQPLQSMHRHLTDTCGYPQTNPSHLIYSSLKRRYGLSRLELFQILGFPFAVLVDCTRYDYLSLHNSLNGNLGITIVSALYSCHVVFICGLLQPSILKIILALHIFSLCLKCDHSHKKDMLFFACLGSQGIQHKFELSILEIFVQYLVVWMFYSDYGFLG